MEKTKVGVIGLGGIAQLVHLPILSSMENVVVTAAADINKNRLRTVSKNFNIDKTYLDYKELLEKENLDAVIIATPTDTHAQMAIDSLSSGKNILIEKPIARTYEEAKKINDVSKKTDKKVMVGMNFRYRPDTMLMRSLINNKELGEISYIKCSWFRQQSSDEQWFINKSKSGGGVLIDLGIVLLDLALWFIGYPSVKSLSVQNFHHNIKETEDSSVGFLRFENDVVVSYDVSWSFHSEKESMDLAVYGSKGTAYLNPFRAYKKVDNTYVDYTPSKSSNVKSLFRKSYENELKYFIGSLRGEFQNISSSEDALTRMKLMESIYKSAATKKEINF